MLHDSHMINSKQTRSIRVDENALHNDSFIVFVIVLLVDLLPCFALPVCFSHFTAVTSPSQPSVSVGSTAATSISISWSVPASDSVVDSYVVMWQKATSEASTIVTVTITDASTSYTLRGLSNDTLYSITVMANNAAGSTTSVPILVSTSVEGQKDFSRY